MTVFYFGFAMNETAVLGCPDNKDPTGQGSVGGSANFETLASQRHCLSPAGDVFYQITSDKLFSSTTV